MKYGSVCSGIESATVAWHPLGWEPSFFAEVDKFPSAVLAHHYPSVPNVGDFTKIGERDVEPIELLVGGTPCQSFSVAGKRLGLDDPRGNLALEFLALARRLRPRWLVFENVPGLLSSDEGRDFGAFLGSLEQCGYGWAYRVLDAQYVRVDGYARAVPQRRRRVFVVGYFGDWRPAAAVLLEPEGLRGDPAPRREAGKGTAGSVKASLERCSADEAECGTLVAGAVAFGGNNTEGPVDVATACRAKGGSGHGDFESETFVAVPPVADPISASEAGTYTHEGRGNFRLHNCVAFSCKDHGADAGEDTAPTLRAMGHDKTWENGGGQVAVAFKPSHYTRGKDGAPSDTVPPLQVEADYGDQDPLIFQPRVGRNGRGFEEGGVVPALNGADAGSTSDMRPCVATRAAVRRLTPRECERLQGFPEIQKSVTVNVWPSAEHQRNAALAEARNLKLPVSVLPADGSESPADASPADLSSPTSHQAPVLPVVLHALIDLERTAVEIHSAGRLIWSASDAVRPSASPLPMPLDAFVRLIAAMNTCAVSEAQRGKAASQPNTKPSLRPLSGSAFVQAYGQEIEGFASGADAFTGDLSRCIMSTTSPSGPTSLNCGENLQTLSSYAVAAIASFIPSEIRAASSYAVTFETAQGYTLVPYRGKPAADGPRYKALGNAMAINCMRWIGARISLYDRTVLRRNAA